MARGEKGGGDVERWGRAESQEANNEMTPLFVRNIIKGQSCPLFRDRQELNFRMKDEGAKPCVVSGSASTGLLWSLWKPGITL